MLVILTNYQDALPNIITAKQLNGLPAGYLCDWYTTKAMKMRRSAIARERQIKKWSRAKKEALIAGNTDNLKKTKQT